MSVWLWRRALRLAWLIDDRSNKVTTLTGRLVAWVNRRLDEAEARR